MGTATRFKADFGLDNGNNSITNLGVSGASLTRAGAHALTLTTSGATTATLPSGTVTLVDLAATQTLTGKTISGASNTLTVRLANDVTGTLPVANGGTGLTTIGTNGQVLRVNAGGTALEWATLSAGSGDVVAANNNAFTGANTFTNSTGQTFRRAANQDGVLLRGSGTGTGGWTVELVPATLSASVVLTLPAATDTLVGRATTDTLTNKTLTSPTLTTPVLGTPSSGTLTNCTGLPVSGITASTTAALGVGSIELGHATDTTIARSSAGVVTIEGVTIATASNTLTLTNKTIALGSNTVSGTKANFNTACTDDDFAYVGTANAFTAAQTITSISANQLVVRYDVNNGVNFDVSSAGLLTVTPKTGNMIVTGANNGGWVLGEWTQASGTGGYAMLGHKALSHTGYGNYALYQTSTGQTAINAVSGQELQLCNNNTVIAKATSTGFSAKLVPAVNSTITTNTITPNADVDNMLSATGLTAGLTIANHTGTPQNGQRLMVRLKDNGTSRTLTFGTAYVAGGVALPTATTAGKMTHLGFIYDTGAAKWMLIASVTEA